MPNFALRCFQCFFALRVVSVLLHYMGPSPWGGALVLSPDRFIPEALAIEAGVWALLCGAEAWLERLLFPALPADDRSQSASKHLRAVRRLRAGFLGLAVAILLFSQIDFEVTRWLGQHMTLSYIKNFAGARDGQLFSRILSGDVLFSSLAVLQMVAAVVAAGWLWQTQTRAPSHPTRRCTLSFALMITLGLSSCYWLRPSEKRWRRVRPASIGILADAWDSALGADAPEHPERARQDLLDWVVAGRLDANVQPEDPRYPLLRRDNVGKLSPRTFRQLPAEDKLDVVLIVFETMRGQNTGLLSETDDSLMAMPRLRDEIRENALYFPRMHAASYPSVGGAMGMHLGMWPHHSRIVFSNFLHIRTIGFPEMLRSAGYESLAVLGADPSFSNFTPWFRRWYDTMEYRAQNHHDGPLVDRFIELYDARVDSPAPQLLTLWTATTHPPYDVPPESGVTPADTTEERYLQAMRYADAQLARLLDHLKRSPRWDRTLVFLLGDHSQPTPYQWQHLDQLGELGPGHTWTSLAILGGESALKRRGRDDRTVSHVDLGPTILSAVNLKHDNHFFGIDLLGTTESRPAMAFRFGAISLERDDRRSVFRIDSPEVLTYRFDPQDVRSYGALQGGTRTTAEPPPEVARLRDAARAWAQLLQDGLVAPPDPEAQLRPVSQL